MYLSEYARLKKASAEYADKLNIAQNDLETTKKALEAARLEYGRMETALEERGGRIDALKNQISDIQLEREKAPAAARCWAACFMNLLPVPTCRFPPQ